MTNGAFDSLDEIMDIESHNVDKMAKKLGIINPFRWKMIRATSRDNARTPMQWTADEGAGFTSGKPWLKINPNYKEVNVEKDLSDSDGIIAFFKRINALRKSSEVLLFGDFTELCATKYIYAYKRSYNGKTLIAVFNFSTTERKLPFDVVGELIISNYRDKADTRRLRPYEFMLIEESVK